MHRHLLFLITAATALLPLMASSLSASNSLSNCNRTFSCGPLINVSYPFTSGDCPAHCGPPEFHLGWVGDSPELTTDSLTYCVLALDQTHRSLTLSRTDLYDNTCLSQYANTTLNSTIFIFASDNKDLTLFYECWAIRTSNPKILFSCEITGTETGGSYSIDVVPTATGLILNESSCDASVTIPILQSVVILLTANGSKLGEALMEGFEVNYTNPYEDRCVMCGGIGGERGFDSDQGYQICPTSAIGTSSDPLSVRPNEPDDQLRSC